VSGVEAAILVALIVVVLLAVNAARRGRRGLMLDFRGPTILTFLMPVGGITLE
jgi:hypothetical protein